MPSHSPPRLASLAALVALLLGGCGGGGGGSTSATSAGAASGGGSSGSSAGALSADATSARTGDIPDTQNFLTFAGTAQRFSMLYPEGWTVQKTSTGATFQDKNNQIRIAVASGPTPTAARVDADLATLKRTEPSLRAGPAQPVTLKSGPAFKASYTTQSAPNQVTGKRVTLMVDRYVVGHAGRVATIDLGTPAGVDNIDAYKRMIASFQWH